MAGGGLRLYQELVLSLCSWLFAGDDDEVTQTGQPVEPVEPKLGEAGNRFARRKEEMVVDPKSQGQRSKPRERRMDLASAGYF